MTADLPPFPGAPPGGLVAGPILRRADPGRVRVWMCTLGPARPRLLVYPAPGGQGQAVGSGGGESVRLGERLHVHLLTATPDAGRFPVGELLSYDVELDADGRVWRLADLGLLGGAGALGYRDAALPTFFLQAPAAPLRVLHGSCRNLHSKGEDAFLRADELLGDTAADLSRRPSALLLTGDQIYADDVTPDLARHLSRLGRYLTGRQEQIPGLPPPATPGDGERPGAPGDARGLGATGDGARERQIREHACFTSPHAANHLMTLGEYAAAYLMAFSDAVWPAADGAAGSARMGRGPGELAGATGAGERGASGAAGRQTRWASEGELGRARAALPAVRRVLANVPTYMIFDDHDVTDDWNLTGRWRERVRESPAGRRIVANALAAYWAFQGWGNDPRQFGPEFTAAIRAHLSGGGEGLPGAGDSPAGRGEGRAGGSEGRAGGSEGRAGGQEGLAADAGSLAGDAGARYDRALWDFGRWSFSCPTTPVTVCLDTRTQRAYDSPEGGARLIGPDGLDRVARLVDESGHDRARPLLLVSAAPVWGLELVERRQKFLAGTVGPYRIDFEGWHANLRGMVDLMDFLTRRLGLNAVVVLSGDVHYGMSIDVRFTVAGATLRLAQLVSSGMKHSGTLTRAVLTALGRLSRRRHERVGWASPPALPRARRLGRRLMRRPVSTDAWAPAAPVFLSPALARRLEIREPPDYREARTYLRPSGPSSSVLTGRNNIGSVTVDGHKVTHVLLCGGRAGARLRADLDLSAS